jgi:phenylacetate-CoA ligase
MTYGGPRLQRLYYSSPRLLQEGMASVYGYFHRRAARGAHFDAWYRYLVRQQFASAEENFQNAWRRLQEVLTYAYEQTVFYREAFESAGLTPGEIRSPEDLCCLPLLTKEEVRERFFDLIAAPYRGGKGIREVHTSGTTGKALTLWVSQECYEREYAYRALHYSFAGATLDDRSAFFAGHPVVHVDRCEPPFWRRDWAENRMIFSSQHLFPQFAGEFVEALRRFQPQIIHGYPSSIAWVAQAVLHAQVFDIRPRAVFTGSETLRVQQRELIERAFGCKVLNWYGNGEHVAVITECEKGTLHVQPEHSWLEFLDENGESVPAGAPGKLVATTLGNLAMPLIRYVVGDVIVPTWGQCPCGRQTPLVQAVEGRVEDYIVGADGRLFGRLDHIFKETPAIAEAQLVQREPGSVTLRVVRRPEYAERDSQELMEAARFRLGRGFRFAIEFVDRIPRSANGKFRFVVSEPAARAGTASRHASN